MTKFERYMEDLEAYCKEFGCDKRDAIWIFSWSSTRLRASGLMSWKQRSSP